MILLLIAGAAAVALVVAVVVAVILFPLAMLGADATPAAAAQLALDDIPAELLAVYQAAAGTCEMRWSVLAAIGKIETDHGRSGLPGVRSGANAAGASGPMQFLASTWAVYGVDGSGDGLVDVYDPVDAIWGAAGYLCGNGARDPAQLRSAVWNYNHADWYVDQVLAQAAAYDAGETGGGDARVLVDHPDLSLTPPARQDLLDGTIDQRVIDFLAWALERHTISVSVLRSGHSTYVAGTDRVSNHWYGRGVDIYAVDGELVSASSQLARAFALEAIALTGPVRPSEIGLPWGDLAGRAGAFSDRSHQRHIHAGWSGNPPTPRSPTLPGNFLE